MEGGQVKDTRLRGVLTQMEDEGSDGGPSRAVLFQPRGCGGMRRDRPVTRWVVVVFGVEGGRGGGRRGGVVVVRGQLALRKRETRLAVFRFSFSRFAVRIAVF